MEIITVLVEKTKNNYGACIEGFDGVVCTSDTFEDLKKDMKTGLEFHLEGMKEDNDPIPPRFLGEIKFVYKWDLQTLLKHYSKILTLAALERITGVNQNQLAHYKAGRTCSPERRKEIEKALRKLGKDLKNTRLE